MANTIINDTYLTNIADAIRKKRGTTSTYRPSQMASAISAIPVSSGTISGGGNFTYDIVGWADGTDEQIVRMIQAADLGLIKLADYWNVGDEREFIYTDDYYDPDLEKWIKREIPMKMILMDNQQSNLDLYELISPTPSGRTTGSFIIGFSEVLPPNGDGDRPGINNVGNNPGTVEFGEWWLELTPNVGPYSLTDECLWSASYTREVLRGRFSYENAPLLFRQIVKPVRVLSYNSSYEQQDANGNWVVEGYPIFYASFDTWFVPTATETSGNEPTADLDHNVLSMEQRYFKQYQYYAEDSSRLIKKTQDSTKKGWWTRSPRFNDFWNMGSQYCVLTDGTCETQNGYDNENITGTAKKASICPHAVI